MLGCSQRGTTGVAVNLMQQQLAGNRPAHAPARTYESYVDGQEIASDRYVYTVSTRSLLDDVFASLTVKRGLERGSLDLDAVTEDVVGRCALASPETAARAVDAAAAAAPDWAAVPLATRMRLGDLIRDR